MRFSTTRMAAPGLLALAAGLSACQGNLGTGSGISIPNAPAYNQQPGGPGPASQSRQQVVDGAVYLTGDMTEIPLPPVAGFKISLALGTPGPSPSPTTAASASAAAPTSPGARRGPARGARSTPGSPVPSPSAAPPTANPAGSRPSAAGASLGASAPGAGPSSGASAPPVAGASPGASAPASSNASPGASASPAPGASAGAKTVTKTTAYPDDAPAAPSPQPSGNVQVFANRKALVRGFVQPAGDVALYGLGAVRFTIPKEEQTADRGFTVAVYVAGRRHHETLVASDPKPTLANDVVASDRSDALTLKKGVGYLLVLYGDELPATPAPPNAGYASPGNNPFYTPQPSSMPAGPVGPGYPVGGPTPYPPANPTPYPPH